MDSSSIAATEDPQDPQRDGKSANIGQEETKVADGSVDPLSASAEEETDKPESASGGSVKAALASDSKKGSFVERTRKLASEKNKDADDEDLYGDIDEAWADEDKASSHDVESVSAVPTASGTDGDASASDATPALDPESSQEAVSDPATRAAPVSDAAPVGIDSVGETSPEEDRSAVVSAPKPPDVTLSADTHDTPHDTPLSEQDTHDQTAQESTERSPTSEAVSPPVAEEPSACLGEGDGVSAPSLPHPPPEDSVRGEDGANSVSESVEKSKRSSNISEHKKRLIREERQKRMVEAAERQAQAAAVEAKEQAARHRRLVADKRTEENRTRVENRLKKVQSTLSTEPAGVELESPSVDNADAAKAKQRRAPTSSENKAGWDDDVHVIAEAKHERETVESVRRHERARRLQHQQEEAESKHMPFRRSSRNSKQQQAKRAQDRLDYVERIVGDDHGRITLPPLLPPRQPRSSPSPSRASLFPDDDLSSVESSSAGKPRHRKPLYLRMIAEARKRTIDEENEKHEEYAKVRQMKQRSNPSHADIKAHMAKHDEFLRHNEGKRKGGRKRRGSGVSPTKLFAESRDGDIGREEENHSPANEGAAGSGVEEEGGGDEKAHSPVRSVETGEEAEPEAHTEAPTEEAQSPVRTVTTTDAGVQVEGVSMKDAEVQVQVQEVVSTTDAEVQAEVQVEGVPTKDAEVQVEGVTVRDADVQVVVPTTDAGVQNVSATKDAEVQVDAFARPLQYDVEAAAQAASAIPTMDCAKITTFCAADWVTLCTGDDTLEVSMAPPLAPDSLSLGMPTGSMGYRASLVPPPSKDARKLLSPAQST